jgi:dual specificity protein kinase YAK1
LNKFIKTKNDLDKEKLSCFIHFLKGLLNVDPQQRWNAKLALRHPFITGEKFTGNIK